MADSVRSAQIAREEWDAYKYFRDHGHIDYIQKARQCEAFFAGKQWDAKDLAKLKRERRPAITINKVLSSMMAVMGEQLNNRVDVSFRASASGDPEVASVLDKVYLHIANDNNLDWVESQVFDDGIITSRGYYDIRMDFTKHLGGEVCITSSNSQNTMVDPDAEEYDPDKWRGVITTRWLSLNDIRALYGEDAYNELKHRKKSLYDKEDSIISLDRGFGRFDGASLQEDIDNDPTRRRYRLRERQFREYSMQDHFVDLQTTLTEPIPKKWPRERIQAVLDTGNYAVIRKPHQRIRWRSVIDEIVVHNEVSIYDHFTVVPYFPVFRHGTTIGLVEQELDPARMYNKTISQMFHVVNTTANSGWKLKQNSLKNMTVEELEQKGASTGLVLEVTDVNDVEKIQPNQVPTGLDRMLFLVGEDIKDVSGVSDSVRGFDRADVASKAIAAKKAASSLNFARAIDNLRMTRKMVAERVLDLVQKFYTEERTYRITGGGLQPQTEELTINQVTPEGRVINDVTLGEYSTVITAVPARNDFEDSQFEEAVRLRELGVQVPDHILIEHSHLNRKAEVAEDIKQRTGFGEQTELDQQMQMLEQQLKQLEAAKAQADVEYTQSQTALNLVRAEHTAAEAEAGFDQEDGGIDEAEIARFEAEIRLKKEAQDREFALKEKELNNKIELAREELALKKAESAIKIADARRAAKEKAEATKVTETPSGPNDDTKEK